MSKATGKGRPLRIAVASGKGGTGKTTLAVALALTAPAPALLLDCDVEEPNAALFFPGFGAEALREDVTVPVPKVDESSCIACGACAAFCEFKAVIVLGEEALIFPELCHSCGGCVSLCPTKALREEPLAVGSITEGRFGGLRLIQGELRLGAAMSPPVIRAVKRRAAAYLADEGDEARLAIIDCPPGTACPMTSAVRDADLVLLATEPTPFGLHDLRLAHETVRSMGLPAAAVINRCDLGDDGVERYCAAEGLPVVGRIPFDRRAAEAYSSGGTILSASGAYRPLLEGMHGEIYALLGRELPA